MHLGEERHATNTHIAYPFAEGAIGIARADSEVVFNSVKGRLPVGAVTDACMVVSADTALYLGRIRRDSELNIKFLVYDIPEEEPSDIDITPDQGHVYATVSCPWTDIDDDTGPDYLLAATRVTTGDVRIVLNRAVIKAYLAAWMEIPYTGPGDETGGWFYNWLPFSAITIQVEEPHVTSLTLYGDGWDAGPTQSDINDDVRLASGYNMDLQTSTADAADTSEVEINAVVGAGTGQAPCPEDHTVTSKRTLMGLAALNGDVMIEGGDDRCYEVSTLIMPGVTPYTRIVLQGVCEACCTCDDYKAVLEAVRRMGVKFQSIMDQLNAGRTAYEDAVTKYNAYAVQMYQPTTSMLLEVNGMRGSDTRLKDAKLHLTGANRARLVIGCKNTGDLPLTIKFLKLEFTTPVHGQIDHIAYSLNGVGGQLAVTAFDGATDLSALLPAIHAYTQISFTVRVYTSMQEWISDPSWSMTVTVTPQHGTTALPNLVQTVSF